MLRRNVLIFHAGALGDFVLSWPLAMALGRLYPQSRIICICSSQKGKLLERALRLESIDVENGFSSLFAESANPPENVRKLLAGAHTICSFVARDGSRWASNVAALSPEATKVFIDPVLSSDFDQHADAHLVKQLAATPVLATAVEQMLRSIAERGLGHQPNPAGPVVIHPGAGSPGKCWPIECYRELTARITASGRMVQWVVGEVEIERWPACDLADSKKPASLVELLDLLRNASLFIGNDSGPAHLAGIIGIPTVVLFGTTDPVQWKPLGPKVAVVQKPSLDQISVEDVLAKLQNQ